MGYSESDSIVRADRFKPSGKWYDSIALEMNDYYNVPPVVHDAVRLAAERQGVVVHEGWWLVVLEPYHIHSHPVILKG